MGAFAEVVAVVERDDVAGFVFEDGAGGAAAAAASDIDAETRSAVEKDEDMDEDEERARKVRTVVARKWLVTPDLLAMVNSFGWPESKKEEETERGTRVERARG